MADLSSEDIDRIVSRVVQQLGDAQFAPSGMVQGSAGSVVRLTDRVVSADLLERLETAPACLLINCDAILTPSARELIATRGISVRRDSGHSSTAAPRTQAIVFCCNRANLKRVKPRAPQGALESCQEDHLGSLVFQALDRGQPVAVLTDASFAVAAALNRQPRVRAAAVDSLDQLRRALQQFEVNVVVTESSEAMRHALGGLLRRRQTGASLTAKQADPCE